MFSCGSRSSSYIRCKPHDRTSKTGTDQPRNRKRETVPLPERKGGQLAVTRRTCLDQLSDAAAAARYIASMQRAALAALLDGVTLISVHSLAGWSPSMDRVMQIVQPLFKQSSRQFLLEMKGKNESLLWIVNWMTDAKHITFSRN